ncbi:MAG: hypothetical protein BWY29_00862 [Microgenomates group bacterium ADurb.Bin238]|nr:MAG: hypothetical protein BWY29_00862 [Microgenomates group bacterium ADurb.Bin238]
MDAKFVNVPLQEDPQLPPLAAVVPLVSFKFHWAKRPVSLYSNSPFPVPTPEGVQERFAVLIWLPRSIVLELYKPDVTPKPFKYERTIAERDLAIFEILTSSINPLKY